MLERFNPRLERFNPQIYSPGEARKELEKVHDPTYAFGSVKVDPDNHRDRAKIWSVSEQVLLDVESTIDNARHVHYFPFVMGTYNMHYRTMRMNDISVTDPSMVILAGAGQFESLAMPFLRGIYFIGRKSWWHHESIHARHHFQMADFLSQRDGQSYNNDDYDKYLREAGETIHEAGIEEILTRWQTLRESSGLRQKAVASLALLFYLEYSAVAGIRNLAIDVKNKTFEQIDEPKIRIPAKLAALAAAIGLPILFENQTHVGQQLSELASRNLPLTKEQVGTILERAVVYTDVALIAATFSSREKGALEERVDEVHTTKDYKFPYVYNPAASLARHIDLLRYLGRVWDQIPNHRFLESRKEVEGVKREIDDHVSANSNDNDHRFTMGVVEEALKPLEAKKRYEFPHSASVRGLFTPALYLTLRDRYE